MRTPTLSQKEFHKKLQVTLHELAPFLIKKDLAYGDATRKIIRCLKELFPDGIPHDQISNVYYMIQILNKFSRIATDNDPFGESPWKDCVGYSTLAHANHELQKDRKGTLKKFDTRRKDHSRNQ